MTQTFATTMTVYATVLVHDREPLDRVTGPGGDEWRAHFYGLLTDEDVIEHFVYNAVTNGVHDISRLEGWADCDPHSVTIEVDSTDLYTEAVDG